MRSRVLLPRVGHYVFFPTTSIQRMSLGNLARELVLVFHFCRKMLSRVEGSDTPLDLVMFSYSRMSVSFAQVGLTLLRVRNSRSTSVQWIHSSPECLAGRCHTSNVFDMISPQNYPIF